MHQNILKLVLPVVLFVCLTFIHFVSDFVFQTHAEAMIKHNHAWVRAKHCLIYTVSFFPFFYYLSIGWSKFIAAAAVLFLSHFFEDTYYFVFLWAKHIRRPPEMSEYNQYHGTDPYMGFKTWNGTTLGKILSIMIDQLVHIFFLWVVAFIILS